jgi:hypothetical protein
MSSRLDLDAVLDFAYSESPAEDARSPEDNFKAFCRNVVRRRERNWDNLLVITGRVGVGKTGLGIQIFREVEGAFNLAAVAYSAEEVIDLYRNLPDGGTMLYDESVLGLLSQGGGRDDELRMMVQALSVVRVKRITAILCVPDLRLLDAFVKYGRAQYWLHVRNRGTAKVHKAWIGAKYRVSISKLPYDEARAYNPLGFGNLAVTDPDLWREYEDQKKRRVNEWLDRWRLDPSGKISRCSVCGYVGTKFNVATHKCPGPPPAPEGGAFPRPRMPPQAPRQVA